MLAKSADGDGVVHISEIVMIFEEVDYHFDENGGFHAKPAITATRFMATDQNIPSLINHLNQIQAELLAANPKVKLELPDGAIL